MLKTVKLSYTLPTFTPELAKLRSGFLLKDILDRSVSKSQNRLVPNQSLWMYSAHEATIANMLNSLGLFTVCIFFNTFCYHFLIQFFF